MANEGARPLLLDLFCGAGGAGMGYYRAGFDVMGVDIEPQPHYPFRFVQADAMAYLEAVAEGGQRLRELSAVHASPICYRWSKMRDCRPGSKDDQPDLITPIRPLLQATGLPYVIENVPGAPLVNPARVCGTGLGLRVQRHRDFECSFPAWSVPCAHGQNPWNPAYKHSTGRKRRRVPVIGEWRTPRPLQYEAMGIGWMTLEELTEAIPPAYTEHIGLQLMTVLETSKGACALCPGFASMTSFPFTARLMACRMLHTAFTPRRSSGARGTLQTVSCPRTISTA